MLSFGANPSTIWKMIFLCSAQVMLLSFLEFSMGKKLQKETQKPSSPGMQRFLASSNLGPFIIVKRKMLDC